jgi:hypothetical protein
MLLFVGRIAPPGVLRSSEFKLKSGINGSPYGLPPFIPF